jgi:hypothetical protein
MWYTVGVRSSLAASVRRTASLCNVLALLPLYFRSKALV